MIGFSILLDRLVSLILVRIFDGNSFSLRISNLRRLGGGSSSPSSASSPSKLKKMRNTEKIPLGIFENITKTNEEESKSTEIDKWCGRSYIIYIFLLFELTNIIFANLATNCYFYNFAIFTI